MKGGMGALESLHLCVKGEFEIGQRRLTVVKEMKSLEFSLIAPEIHCLKAILFYVLGYSV